MNNNTKVIYTYDHKKASKPSEVEEVLDFYINRKVAKIFVKLFLNTSVTPNMITYWSMLIGIIGGLSLIIYGIPPIISAFFIFLSVVLDCTDGQLARARGGGSMTGRVLDGLADYIYSAAYFLGMIIYTGHYTDTSTLIIWLWAFVGSFSTMLHTYFFDMYKNIYISYTQKDYKEKFDSYEEIKAEIFRCRENKEFLSILFLYIYLTYNKLQTKAMCSSSEDLKAVKKEYNEEVAIQYRKYFKLLIKLWGLLGISVHLYLVIIATLLALFWQSSLLYCFIFFAVPMNVLLIILLIFQHKNNKKFLLSNIRN